MSSSLSTKFRARRKASAFVFYDKPNSRGIGFQTPEMPSWRDKHITVCTEDISALHPIGVDVILDIPEWWHDELRTM
jgi:hypothetical protein